VLSLSGPEVRVLQAARRGDAPAVQRWASVEAPADEDGRARAAVQALERAGIRERRVLVCLPARAVVLRRVELPPAEAEQLPQLVAFEAQRHLSLPVDQLATGFCELPKRSGASGCEVLLAVTRRAELARLERSLLAVGIRVEGYAASPLAVADAWLDAATPGRGVTSWLLVAPEEDGLVAQAVCGELPVFTRFLPRNGESWKGDLRRSLAAHALQSPEEAVQEVFLAGDVDASGLSAAWAVPVREIGNSTVPGSGELTADWAALVGAARQSLGTGHYPLRLEPQGKPEAARTQGRSRALAGMVAALAVAVALGGWQFDRQRRSAADLAEADRLTGQSAQDRKLTTALVKQREKLKGQWTALGGASVTGDDPPLELLRRAAALAPPGVWLTEMTFERGQPLRLQGSTRDAAQVGRWQRSLEQVGGFRAVELGYLRSATVGETPVTQFRIDCTLAEVTADKASSPRAVQQASGDLP
jgi:Tfp pilus assembly protein PilN